MLTSSKERELEVQVHLTPKHLVRGGRLWREAGEYSQGTVGREPAFCHMSPCVVSCECPRSSGSPVSFVPDKELEEQAGDPGVTGKGVLPWPWAMAGSRLSLTPLSRRAEVAGRLRARQHPRPPTSLTVTAVVLAPVHVPTQLTLSVLVRACILHDSPTAAPQARARSIGLLCLALQLPR